MHQEKKSVNNDDDDDDDDDNDDDDEDDDNIESEEGLEDIIVVRIQAVRERAVFAETLVKQRPI